MCRATVFSVAPPEPCVSPTPRKIVFATHTDYLAEQRAAWHHRFRWQLQRGEMHNEQARTSSRRWQAHPRRKPSAASRRKPTNTASAIAPPQNGSSTNTKSQRTSAAPSPTTPTASIRRPTIHPLPHRPGHHRQPGNGGGCPLTSFTRTHESRKQNNTVKSQRI